ncbi:MAG: AmmeMemoRadiSam system protein B [Planctomycetota bacterium]
MSKPKLRLVEVIPTEQDGHPTYALRDPTGIATDTVMVSPGVAYILQRFDGNHTLEDIQAELKEAVREEVPIRNLRRLADSLDKAHFLVGPRFLAHREAVLGEYRSAECRTPALAGQAYPETREDLFRWYEELQAPNFAPVAGAGELLGFAAPHIDPQFGGAAAKLVHAIHRRRSPDVDTVVVLGTGHCAERELYTITRQHYGTPIGKVRTDRDLADGLLSKVGETALLGEEFQHLAEHSVEFQALFLRLAGGQEGGSDEPPMILPVLVGTFIPFLESGTEPYADARVRGFVEGLLEEIDRLGRKVSFLASIDLAHMGPRYGDADGLTPEQMVRVELADRKLLRYAERGDAEGFFQHHRETGDSRRVCGFSALYTLLRLLPGARGQIAAYTQTTFPGSHDTVSHCAMLFERSPD